jgi:hypothetical protein
MTAHAARVIHAAAMEILHKTREGEPGFGAFRMQVLVGLYGPDVIPTVWMYWGQVIAKDRIHKGIPAGNAILPPALPHHHCYDIAARVVDACRSERPDPAALVNLAEEAQRHGEVGGVSATLAVIACMIVYPRRKETP